MTARRKVEAATPSGQYSIELSRTFRLACDSTPREINIEARAILETVDVCMHV